MKTKITFLIVCFFLLALNSYGQKNAPKSIISGNVTIEKYHSVNELKQMPKGQLLDLYMERIAVLVQIVPYMAFATKPGVTMVTLGIPNNSENRKKLEDQHENTTNYIEETAEFQKAILPYSDTNKLITAVLFYEDIMKSIHSYEEYN